MLDLRIIKAQSTSWQANHYFTKTGHSGVLLQITKPSRASFLHDVPKRIIVSSSEALLRVGKQCFVFEDRASLQKTPPHIITTPGQP